MPVNSDGFFSHICPHCGTSDTYFSAGEDAWVCCNPECGEIFPIDVALHADETGEADDD